jgi:hypothetical protein
MFKIIEKDKISIKISDYFEYQQIKSFFSDNSVNIENYDVNNTKYVIVHTNIIDLFHKYEEKVKYHEQMNEPYFGYTGELFLEKFNRKDQYIGIEVFLKEKHVLIFNIDQRYYYAELSKKGNKFLKSKRKKLKYEHRVHKINSKNFILNGNKIRKDNINFEKLYFQ